MCGKAALKVKGEEEEGATPHTTVHHAAVFHGGIQASKEDSEGS
jgi:hypothetical protein